MMPDRRRWVLRVRSISLVLFLLLTTLAHATPATTPDPDASLSGDIKDADRTFSGYVSQKSHDLIVKWLRANPHRDLTLHLDSGGGRVIYGIKLYDAIEAHGHVSTEIDPGKACLSACTYVWLSGRTRSLADRAMLGFHSSFCTVACDIHTVGTGNQSILDILARTEPDLAVLISRTGAMISGNRLMALARRENGHWAIRTFQPPP